MPIIIIKGTHLHTGALISNLLQKCRCFLFGAINFSTVRSLAAELYVQYYSVKKLNEPLKKIIKKSVDMMDDLSWFFISLSLYKRPNCHTWWNCTIGTTNAFFYTDSTDLLLLLLFNCVVGSWGMVDKIITHLCCLCVCVCVCVFVCVCVCVEISWHASSPLLQASDLSTVCVELLAFFTSAGTLLGMIRSSEWWMNEWINWILWSYKVFLHPALTHQISTEQHLLWARCIWQYNIHVFCLFFVCLFVAVVCLALSLPTSLCLK